MNERLARAMRLPLGMRPVRFIVVGAINTALVYAIYAALLFAGLHYALANLIALVCGVLWGFQTQGRFVFGHAGPGAFRRFVLVWAGLYLFNIALIRVLLGFGLNGYVAGALALVPVTVLSYLLQRSYVFVRRVPAPPPPPNPR